MRIFGPDHYGVLGLARDTGREEIQRAYLSAARRSRSWHALFGRGPARVRQAFEVLMDPHRRRRYDEDLDRLLVNFPVPPM